MIKLFNSKNSVKSATIILVVTLTLSNIMGMLRDHFLAQRILASDLDIYYAAFRIPDLIFNVIVLGAISSAFIPVFTGFVSKNEELRAWRVANSVLTVGLLCISILAVILFFLMPELIKLLVPEFSPEKQLTTIRLSRLFLITPFIFTVSYIIGGVLNSFKRFMFYSIAPLFYNFSIIVATVFLADRWGIFGVAIGVIFGAFLHMAIQLPGALHLGWRYRLKIDLLDPAVKKIGKLMIPRAIGLGANQMMLFAFTAIASTLAAGSVAIYSLADNIQTMPSVVFGTSLATAIFPTLAEKASINAKSEFANYLNHSIRTIIFLLIPAAVGIILLRAEIIRLILGSGRFGWEETVMASSTLGYFALSLPFSGLVPVLAKAFYAKHDTKTPVVIAVFSIILSIVLGYLFSSLTLGNFGGKVSGLALAFSIGSFFNALFLFIMLVRQKWLSNVPKIFLSAGKIVIAALAMGIFIQISKNYLGESVDMQRFWGVAVKAFFSTVTGLIIYFIMSYLLRIEEMKQVSLRQILSSRFGRSAPNDYNNTSEQAQQ